MTTSESPIADPFRPFQTPPRTLRNPPSSLTPTPRHHLPLSSFCGIVAVPLHRYSCSGGLNTNFEAESAHTPYGEEQVSERVEILIKAGGEGGN